ncbi:MAG: hypothetical protein JSV86_16485 [Gemmatimonadota bacterium]|nr:MAG: hypothetical protein JSV86_16485 [Gemmatimonadota bacterium]
MGPELVEIIAPPIAIISVGALVLIGMKLRYTHKERTRLGGIAQEDVQRLTDSVGALRDEVQHLRDGYLELNERMEFTERLLERPKPEADPRRAQKD